MCGVDQRGSSGSKQMMLPAAAGKLRPRARGEKRGVRVGWTKARKAKSLSPHFRFKMPLSWLFTNVATALIKIDERSQGNKKERNNPVAALRCLRQ